MHRRAGAKRMAESRQRNRRFVATYVAEDQRRFGAFQRQLLFLASQGKAGESSKAPETGKTRATHGEETSLKSRSCGEWIGWILLHPHSTADQISQLGRSEGFFH